MKLIPLKPTFFMLLCMTAGYVGAQTPKSQPLPPLPSAVPAKPTPAPESKPGPERVSLGVSVTKPTTALYAQLPQLPSGSGFLLKKVNAGGAADKAGLKPMDLIWKLGDQILINECQMMVLLSHHRPGDQVKIRYIRSGMTMDAVLNLQAWTAQPPHPDVLARVTPAHPSWPMRVISYEDRSASISDKTGTATLTYREGKLWLHIESEKGEEVFNHSVVETSEIARVPVAWRNRLPILQRSLEESIRLRRLPRVRHVPRKNLKGRVVSGK